VHEKRIEELRKEIEQFDYKRLQKQEEFQQIQAEFQQLLALTKEAILTRKGEIIGLERLQNESNTP
jgi:predicted Zn-dependent protease